MPNTLKAWERYEKGLEYKRRIGLYASVRENERFYRGDQWRGVNSKDLPKPTFNIIKRIIGYMISSVTRQPISVSYSDESLPVRADSENKRAVASGIELLNSHVAYRFDKCRMDALIKDALLDAAISGDGVFYVYWDPEARTGQFYEGDLKTVLVDNVDLYVSNVNSRDIQSQEYVMISGRAPVSELIKQGRANGVDEKLLSLIVPDSAEGTGAGDHSDIENEDAGLCTYLITFYRDKDGCVIWEKCTRACTVARAKTSMKLYPVAYFPWEKTKGSFIGNSPVTSLIENQKYVNKAYALVMKHMTDTAFSKVVYDKTLIPEWSNEVGEAIGVRAGGDVRNAASVIGVGGMQPGFLDVIAMTVQQTKEFMGATDAALGEVDPDNTSAIITLQEASAAPLENLRQNLYSAVEDLALIWAEMLIEYCSEGRLMSYEDRNGETVSTPMPSGDVFKSSLISARIDVGAGTRYSEAVSVNTLDRLLTGGYISFSQYLERLPEGIIENKKEIIEYAKRKEQQGPQEI